MYSTMHIQVGITVEREYDFVRITRMRIATADNVDQHCLRLQSRAIGCGSLLYLEYSSGMSTSNWLNAAAIYTG